MLKRRGLQDWEAPELALAVPVGTPAQPQAQGVSWQRRRPQSPQTAVIQQGHRQKTAVPMIGCTSRRNSDPGGKGFVGRISRGGSKRGCLPHRINRTFVMQGLGSAYKPGALIKSPLAAATAAHRTLLPLSVPRPLGRVRGLRADGAVAILRESVHHVGLLAAESPPFRCGGRWRWRRRQGPGKPIRLPTFTVTT